MESVSKLLNSWPKDLKEEVGEMLLLRTCAFVLLFTVSFYLVGCCGGGKEKVVEKETVVVPKGSTTPTLGQQLEDLKNAYQKGAITKEEYEAGKRRLLGQ